jgi:hypothetical protein
VLALSDNSRQSLRGLRQCVRGIIVLCQKRRERLQRLIDHGGRYHHPDGARRFQLPDEVFNRCCGDCAVLDERLRGFRMYIVSNSLVAGP